MTAYGYAMSGTTLAACAIPTIVTTTLFSTTIFNGARYQTLGATYGINTGATDSPVALNLGTQLSTSGTNALYTTALSVSSYTMSNFDALAITSTQNFWWDFAQTGTFTGQTQFGRGGGASTTPCGYYVVYTLESPGP